MLKRTYGWLDKRLGASSFTRHALNKVFPDHWSFMLGEIALYAFLILVLTGTFLSFFFHASTSEVVYHGSYAPLNGVQMSDAYKSTLDLSFSVRAGLMMRQIHHWAALLFIASIVAHLCRVFFTGAFRRPREINWIIGITLLLLAIFNGFTGYSLPDDLLSGTGLRIAHSIALSVPLVGTWMAFLIFGGEFPSHEIAGRLFVTHIMIVPAAIAVLLSIHLAIVWRQKHTQFPGIGKRETNVVGSKLWPTYAMKSAGLFFGLFSLLAALGGLVQINPVWLYGPFRADQVTSPAQPDWYLGWVEGALRLFPNWEIRAFGWEVPNPFFPAVLLPGLTFLFLYAWPFLEARLTGDHDPHHLLDRARDHPVRTALGIAALSFYVVLFVAASNDLIARWLTLSVLSVTWFFRIALLVVPPVAGWVTYRLMNALRRSGVDRFRHLPLKAVLHPAPGSGSGSSKR
jgi:quinol---cytochrome-c reductase cytochrome b subunit